MASGSRDITRRKFDVSTAEHRLQQQRAASVNQLQIRRDRHAHIDGDPFAPTRAWLTKREGGIDFESKVGTSEVVGWNGGGGFLCKSCGVRLKDSNRYLMHVNSRKHQKLLGVSMRVKRSTLEEVKQAFEKVRRQIESEKERAVGRGQKRRRAEADDVEDEAK
eukprot:GFKZ01013751.1.p1 GENE.GFKZ01013751.1~~GFKZ01013751.1.p1  ORF type:complete len:163 (+),score=28.42 GFKZ01013751.1:61-549(+)